MYLRLRSCDGKLPCHEERAEIARVLRNHGFALVGSITEHSTGGLVVHLQDTLSANETARLAQLAHDMRYDVMPPT